MLESPMAENSSVEMKPTVGLVSNELLSVEAKRRINMAADASVEIETDARLDQTGAHRYEAY